MNTTMSLGLLDSIILPFVYVLFAGFLIGCGSLAWTARICWEFEVRGRLELHGVSITCEACRGTCQGQWYMGRTSPLVKLVRIKIRHCWFWPHGVQEYLKGRCRWAHVSLSSVAKHVSPAHFISYFFIGPASYNYGKLLFLVIILTSSFF